MLKSLTDLGVCEFCTKYFGKQFEFHWPAMTEPPTSLEEIFGKETINLSHFSPVLCPNCLGLAQVANNAAFLNWVIQKTRKSGYEFSDFNFNFKMPLSLKFRQRFVINHLQKLWEETGDKNVPFPVFDFDLKLSIKTALNHAVSDKLGVPASPAEEFIINLEFRNLPDEEELVSLAVRFVRGGNPPDAGWGQEENQEESETAGSPARQLPDPTLSVAGSCRLLIRGTRTSSTNASPQNCGSNTHRLRNSTSNSKRRTCTFLVTTTSILDL
jgi:hypothetical protein